MQRAIVSPAILPGTALGELKQWLAITTLREDASLTQLLLASMETCGAFTRAVPIETTYRELHDVASGWQLLGLAPVRAITGVEGIAADGTRFAIPSTHYFVDLAADQTGRLRLINGNGAVAIDVTYAAGIAASWEMLPAGLRQGIIRLAAYHFRARETDAAGGSPPAAIAALWRPHRRVRLA